ncbi:MAG: bacillithiol system redox-active protein YtxJ [Gloeobacteraceae cyanobacterium ES-bin-316]|nr:bacillithiol system redox-active protein YtxJ [Ferruginibacter sp.]
MNWIPLSTLDEVDIIKKKSFEHPQLIFKHSTRCSISSMAKSRLDRATAPPDSEFYYLDLIAHRNISAHVAETFKVAHESPQVLLIKNGECVYDESHSGIDMSEIAEQIAA